jgi:D-xylose transport system substrate-binding protein
MINRRTGAFLAALAFAAAACSPAASTSPSSAAATQAPSSAATSSEPSEAPSSGAPSSEPSGSQTAGDCTVGVSWNNFQEERWGKFDEPALKGAIEEGGGTYVSNDAKSSAETQASNVENLINQGANVLVILAQDGTAILPSVQAAADQGIPVIAYDRLIEDPNVLYATFDNKGVGKIMAELLLEEVPEGNFAIIKGNAADANADFLREGMTEAGVPAPGETDPDGAINIVGEEYTDNWDPSTAQTNMEQILTDNNNEIDAVLSENDGMAGGVVAALEAQGLAGQVPVTGQDGDKAALNRVALGTQLVSVWKDGRELGRQAGEAAVALCGDPDLASLEGTVQFDTPGGNTLTSYILDPTPIQQDNLQEVIDAEVVTEEELCAGVEAGSVDACP